MKQKIDSLADSVIALARQTEKRAKNVEQLVVQTQWILDSSSSHLDGSTERIRQEVTGAVRSGLEQLVGKFTKRLETTGCWPLETVCEVESRQQRSAKDLKKLAWVSVAVFALTGLLCLDMAIYLIQSIKTEMKRVGQVTDTNKVVENGKLSRCGEDGGTCAKVKGKSVRLDK